jgi:gamma-glutamyltranspeptidase/glutathione hydrolase
MRAHRGVVVARGGGVAASQPLAVSTGLNVLSRGGSFADAAIAASAVLCVVEPQASHLGGDAFLVVYDAPRRNTIAFNGSGAAPRTATPESYGTGIPVHGLRAATVPGLVSAWFALHERFGTMPIADLLAPAIAYADSGFPAGPRLARVCADTASLFAARPTLSLLGISPTTQMGDMVRQPDLAATLQRIAEYGQNGFYSGPVAERIARQSAGHFSTEDLAEHRTRVLPPLQCRYRDVVVHGQPPPSQGHILLQELLIAAGFDLAAMGPIERSHVLVEAKKLAFSDRNAFLADPECADVPVDGMLSERYAAARRRLIAPDRAAPAYDPGDLSAFGSDTTYFLVADREGNAVSFIQSIFHGFGCAEVVEGTGVLFNNRLTGFVLDPTSPNYLEPGKRPAHTLNAWLATRPDGRLAFVGGSPGGHVQVQTNLQLVVNLVDLGMNPQEAVEAPRWQHLDGPSSVSSPDPSGAGILEVEDRAGAPLINGLRDLGHDVQPIGPWSHSSAAQVMSCLPNGSMAFGSDPRCDGHAAGV